ncbi:MAG: hypothetical protein Q7R73_00605 [bacterium]|nr:hypothetical protein [bacterium]
MGGSGGPTRGWADIPEDVKKKRFPWFSAVLIAVVLGVVLYSAFFGNFDPSSYPGEFGY